MPAEDFIWIKIWSFICLCREQIFRQSTELVCRAYGEVYTALISPSNGYKDAETLVPRSPKQVQTLLSWETLCPITVQNRAVCHCTEFKKSMIIFLWEIAAGCCQGTYNPFTTFISNYSDYLYYCFSLYAHFEGHNCTNHWLCIYL